MGLIKELVNMTEEWKPVPKGWWPFMATLPSILRAFSLPHLFLNMGCCQLFLCFSGLLEVKWHFTVIIFCFSLISGIFKHLLICLWIIHDSSSVNCLLFFSLGLTLHGWFVDIFAKFWTVVHFVNNFPQLLFCVFILIMVSLMITNPRYNFLTYFLTFSFNDLCFV